MKYLITHYTITQGDRAIFDTPAIITASSLDEARREAKTAFIRHLLDEINVSLTYREVPDETDQRGEASPVE